MNRFAPVSLALLLVVAILGASCGQSRDSAAVEDTVPGGDDSTTTLDGATVDGADVENGDTTITTATTAPPTTGQAADEAIEVTYPDGETLAVTHGELADYAYTSRTNETFVKVLFNGEVPYGFDQTVLTGLVVNDVLERTLSSEGAEVSQADTDAARDELLAQIVPYFGDETEPEKAAEEMVNDVPYLQMLIDARSRQVTLGKALADKAEPTEDVPCVRHILVETKDEADDLMTQLADGAEFGELAEANSTDVGSGANGGELGCTDPGAYVPAFADAVNSAEVNEVVGPVESEFGFHIIEVYGYEPAEVNPDQLATAEWTGMLAEATVEVDPALGTWDSERLAVAPPP